MNFIAITSLAEQAHLGEPLPGSEFRPCQDCGRICVLSPSTVKQRPTWVLCYDCGLPLMAARPDLLMAPTIEAMMDWLELQRRARRT